MELNPFPIRTLVLPLLVAVYLSGCANFSTHPSSSAHFCVCWCLGVITGNGYRKGSLSLSGALAALTVGFVIMSSPLRVFGVTLIVFYLAGSKVN